MTISASSDGQTQEIKISGRFDFSVQSEFRQAYENTPPSNLFVLDFSEAEYMDSSALGMLLLLRDYAGGEDARIEIKNPRPEIRNILEISNFQKLFKVV